MKLFIPRTQNIPLSEVMVKTRVITADFAQFSDSVEPLKLLLYRLFDSPQSGAAEIGIRDDDEQLKSMLDDMQRLTFRTRAHLGGPNVGKYLTDNINVLIRQVGRYFQTCDGKESGYVFYWFVLNFLWHAEQLLLSVDQRIEEEKRFDFQINTSEVENKIRDEWANRFEDLKQERKAETQEYEQKLRTLQKRIKDMELDAARKDEENKDKGPSEATSSLVDKIEKDYRNVREALNLTYDNELLQYKYLHDYFQISKDIAMKTQSVRKETGTQTDLSLSSCSACIGGISANCMDADSIRSLGSPLMSFVNSFVLEYPEKDMLPWDEIYGVSEKILQGHNFPTPSEPAEAEERSAVLNIHEACLHTFLHKPDEKPDSAALSAYRFLNTVSKNDKHNLYAEYMCRVFALNSYRKLTPAELCVFLKKRGKLTSKYCGSENMPPMNAQIPFAEVFSFVASAFGKQFPRIGSLVFSYLHCANKKSMASLFGYTYLESASLANSYFRKKGILKESAENLESYVSRHICLMHLLNVMLKDLRVPMRVAFEKDDRGDSGLVRAEVMREVLRKVGPVGLCDSDERSLLEAFENRDGDGMFQHKTFLDLLNAIDYMKQGDCTVSIFGVCYAILRAVTSAGDCAGTELKQRLGVEKVPGEYFEMSLMIQQLPKDLRIGQFDSAYIYNEMKRDPNDLSTESFVLSILKLIGSRGSLDTQTKLLEIATLVGRKDLQGSRKAGLSEYAKAIRKTPRGGGATPVGGSGSSRRGAVVTPTTFGEAAIKAVSPRDKSGAKQDCAI